MKYFSEDSDYINTECEHCRKILKIKKALAVSTSAGFDLNPPSGIRCVCGAVHHRVVGKGETTGSQKIICPHCQQRGYVTTKKVQRKKGISGAKATGALLTGGLSIFLTGLSRKEEETEAHCSFCGATWHFS